MYLSICYYFFEGKDYYLFLFLDLHATQQHFYKQRQAEIDKKLSKSLTTP